MGNEICTVIAGYHWFTDWGRDTMISLEGLTLQTGRQREAAFILRDVRALRSRPSHPKHVSRRSNEGLYHTPTRRCVFHAVEAYVRRSGDEGRHPNSADMVHIVEHHLKGTRFGIKDPSDGLLRQALRDISSRWMPGGTDKVTRGGERRWRSTRCGTTRWPTWDGSPACGRAVRRDCARACGSGVRVVQ
jgi:glycogen debranching enzyme